MRAKNRQEVVALALATGQEIKATAAACGVAESTIHRWLHEESFRQRVDELRTALFDAAVGKLAGLSGQAVDVLERLLTSKKEAVRLSAARTILQLGPDLREQTDLAARLDDLKRRIEEQHHVHPGPTAGSPRSPAPGADTGGSGPPGSVPAGSLSPDGGRGDATGPVAAGLADVGGAAPVAPLFEAGG